MDVWVYSNLDVIELYVNGVSNGTRVMPQYDHVEWDGIPWVGGSIQAVGYKNGTTDPVLVQWRNTTGPGTCAYVSVCVVTLCAFPPAPVFISVCVRVRFGSDVAVT